MFWFALALACVLVPLALWAVFRLIFPENPKVKRTPAALAGEVTVTLILAAWAIVTVLYCIYSNPF